MRRKQPEESFFVSISGDLVSCSWPDGSVQAVNLQRLRDFHVETNDSGPWGIDVRIVLRDNADQQCSFPLGATGEEAVLDRLRQLPGFQLGGMNATANAHFLCWPRDAEGQARD